MTEQNQTSRLPEEGAWQRAAEIGERVVRDGLTDRAMRRMKRGASDWDPLALGFGAHKAAVEYLVAMARPEGRHVIEANLVATIRGVCRGFEWPVNDDNSPYESAP